MTLDWAVMPKVNVIWPVHLGMLVDLLQLADQCTSDTTDTMAHMATLLGRLMLTSLVHGAGHKKGNPKLCQPDFQHGA